MAKVEIIIIMIIIIITIIIITIIMIIIIMKPFNRRSYEMCSQDELHSGRGGRADTTRRRRG